MSKTLCESSRELREAWRDFILRVAYALRVDRACNGVTRIIRRLTACLFVAFLCLWPATGLEAGDVYRPGDMFATRNASEEDNTSPGHWNHLAVYIGEGLVVEAQIGKGVVYAELAEFIDRYPEIRVMRLRKGDGRVMADACWRQVGTPYWKLASVPRFMRPARRGNNCVSVLRRGYIATVGRDPGWLKPDDMVGDPSIEILYAK